jgi:transcriptional regulator with XRE-family HTH domain
MTNASIKKKRKPYKSRVAKYTPTEESRKHVELLVAYGLTLQQIASIMDVTDTTIEKYYSSEMKNGLAKANSLIANRLFKTATEGEGHLALTAQIFWLKTRARWRETDRLEITGEDGGPIRAGVIAIPAKFKSVKEWQQAYGLEEEPLSIDAESPEKDEE